MCKNNLFIFLFVIIIRFHSIFSVFVSEVRIIPSSVKEGGRVLLECLYNLNGEELYCIKWYRGIVEFYRYCPSEVPPTRTYHLSIFNVDLANSNATQVVLRNVKSRLGGNFTCEVSGDAPAFLTFAASNYMEVVRIPQGGPVIVSEYPTYKAGDTLRINCTVPPSYPPPNITFFINNKEIPSGIANHREIERNLFQSDLRVSLHLLEEHFRRGEPILTCVAKILDLYSESAELVLKSKRGPPKVERVTSTANTINKINAMHRIIAEFLILIYIINK